jgi:hypothetical protein
MPIGISMPHQRHTSLEVLVYFLKAKQGYTVRKEMEGKWV